MRPVSSLTLLEPHLKHHEQRKASKKSEDQDTSNEEEEDAKPVQPQIRRRETAKQKALRINSFAYQQRLIDDESWVELETHGMKVRKNHFY